MMNIFNRLEQKVVRSIDRCRNLVRQSDYDFDQDPSQICHIFKDRTEQYKYYNHFFKHRAPSWLKKHRAFYSRERRGFGEDAFHAFWFLLFKELQPKNFLEIGVYRGQTLSLIKLIAKNLQRECKVLGVSPFTPLGDEVSRYIELDYLRDTLNLSEFIGVPLNKSELLKALSSSPEALDKISQTLWDIIYVDGNHNYENVVQDLNNCITVLAPNGVIVVDDSALFTNYSQTPTRFAGHPGPSRALDEFIRDGLLQEVANCGHLRAVKKHHLK